MELITEFRDRLLKELIENENLVKEVLSKIDEDEFNRKPSPERWSIGEQLEHLIVTANLYIPKIKIVLDTKSGKNDITRYNLRFIPKKFIYMMDPPVKRRIKTFKPFLPANKINKEELQGSFLRIHQEIKTLLNRTIDEGKVKLIISSPVNKLIKLQLGEVFSLISIHAKRHIWITDKMTKGEY